MAILASDFTANSLSGTATVVLGNVIVDLTPSPYALEGDKSFVIKIRKGSSQGTVVATSPPITIKDRTTVVSLSANVSSVAEGNLVSFSLVTTNVVNGISVFYSVLPVTSNVTSGDFESNTGSTVITNNAATFALKAAADVSLSDETGETFKVQLRGTSVTGNVVFVTSNVVILDTYKTYNVLSFVSGTASPVLTGTSVTFTFTATNVPSGTLLYYDTTGNVETFTSNTGSFALNGLSNTIVITNPQATANTFYNVVVRSGSAVGNVIATSNTMGVTYIPPPPRYLWTWGFNHVGQLGLGTSGTSYSSPKQVGALTTWSSVDYAYVSFLGITNNNKLWGWGQNTNGQLGHGNTTNYSSPKQVGALANWASISGGTRFSVAVKTNGTLWSWGNAQQGRLGLNTNQYTYYSSPKQIGALTSWLSSCAGYLAGAAIKTDGTLWTWGGNGYGAMGIGNTTDYSSPKQVGALTTWSKISGVEHAFIALKTDGTLWSWGRGMFGVLGLGSETNRSSPVQVGALTTWSKLSSTKTYVLAVKSDGTMWAWGRNRYGELGIGDTTDRSSPVQVGALTTWSNISAGETVSSAIKTDGTLWTWGEGLEGGLGLGDTISRSSPVQVGTSTNWLDISGGSIAMAAIAGAPKSLTVTGVVAGTSSPIYTGTNVTYTVSATDVTLGTLLYYSTTGNVSSFTSNVGSISLNGASNTFVIAQPNSAGIYNVVVKTGSQSGTVVATSNTMVVNTPPVQYLWAWGNNYFGGLGLGNTTNVSSPTQVGSLTNWSSVDGDYCTLALKTDGSLWSWGYNNSGQLGLGDTTNRSSPVQIGALTNWLRISAGQITGMAIKTDGTLWVWGSNSYGKLGLGNTTSQSSPTQVGALTTWSSVNVGNYNSAAIKTDGTLWTWGFNSYGNLGLGDTTNRSSPVQIGALTNWSSVSIARSSWSAALKNDGTLWMWGSNTFGELGLSDTNNRSSPTQVGALTTWLSVAAGNAHCAAIKNDGTLWAWGYNVDGKLGQGNTTDRSSPVQVGALTTWLSVSGGSNYTAAIKTDGTLWTWGKGTEGRLGLGNTTYFSSPKQVGALTNWLSVSAGIGSKAISS